jgi:glutathione synthase
LNDPTHLKYFSSKASLAAVDSEFCPPLVVSNRSDLIADFVRRSETTCVIKPVIGSRGQNIIRVRYDDEGLESLIESKFNSGGIVAQHFVNADPVGDKRVVVLCGEVLEVEGHLAGIERRPAQGDFRANLHAGGTAHPLTLSKSARSAAEYAASLLFEHGILLAGVDLIEDKIIEFNVYSTGGLFDAESYSGVSFSDAIARRIGV